MYTNLKDIAICDLNALSLKNTKEITLTYYNYKLGGFLNLKSVNDKILYF